jgi:hypothetical protein
MIVLGLAGAAGSGKDSVADYLVRCYGFVKFSFSDALYREVAEAFGLEDESLLRDRATKEVETGRLALGNCKQYEFVVRMAEYSDDSVATYLASLKVPHSPRQILQWWGTEYRRAQNPNYWVIAADNWLRGLKEVFPYPETRPQLFVNTSIRFENERAWIHSFEGGNVWHIHRDSAAPVAAHESEAPLPVVIVERELWNNYTLEYLHKGVDQLLRSNARFARMEPPQPDVEPTTE